MVITNINIKLLDEEVNSKVKGHVKLVFNECFVVNSIRIIEGDNGLFIAMPSRKKATGEYKDIVHPINNEMRKYITDYVLVEYQNLINTGGC